MLEQLDKLGRLDCADQAEQLRYWANEGTKSPMPTLKEIFDLNKSASYRDLFRAIADALERG